MLTKEDKDGTPRFAVWVKKLNPAEDEPISDDEVLDITDVIINARIMKHAL